MTGSVARAPVQAAPSDEQSKAPLPQSDLAYARAAASELMARGGKDASAPWRNPQTGAGGNITPLAAASNRDGQPCRDFLASYVHGPSQVWLHGAACQTGHGQWEVTSLTPLDRG